MALRSLTAYERSLLERLLHLDFPGRNEIRQQIEECDVEVLDSDGSFRFDLKNAPPVVTKFRVPIEAEAMDSDGTKIHVLLHVVMGKVEELEVFKDDGSPVATMPPPEAFELFCPADWNIR